MFSLMETLDCPNCAAEVVVDGRYAHVAVCASCRSVITYGQDAAKVRGELSLLPTGSTPLYVDARGRVKGERFVVLGRVRYGYGSGYWDEWYLELEDGGIGWLVEDEGRLSYERSVPNPEVSFDALELGGEVALGGTPFRVKEKNVAQSINTTTIPRTTTVITTVTAVVVAVAVAVAVAAAAGTISSIVIMITTTTNISVTYWSTFESLLISLFVVPFLY